MIDTFTAYSPGAPTTGADGMTEPTWVNEGSTKGKVRGQSLVAHDTAVGNAFVGLVYRSILQGTLHIPVSAPLPVIGWEYVCTAVGTGTDPALVGTRWRVANVPVETYMTARRCDVVRL